MENTDQHTNSDKINQLESLNQIPNQTTTAFNQSSTNFTNPIEKIEHHHKSFLITTKEELQEYNNNFQLISELEKDLKLPPVLKKSANKLERQTIKSEENIMRDFITDIHKRGGVTEYKDNVRSREFTSHTTNTKNLKNINKIYEFIKVFKGFRRFLILNKISDDVAQLVNIL